jgi:hypothetical protein
MTWGGLALTILMGSVACSAVSRADDWSTVTAEEFSRQLGNATGYFVLSRLLRDHAVERGASASVILLGSMYGVVGSYPDAYEDICAASPVAYTSHIGGLMRDGWKVLGQRYAVPVKISGHAALLGLSFEHEQAAALGTLLTARMLDRGFLTGSGFYPSYAHKEHHVTQYFAALEPTFTELADAIREGDVLQRLQSIGVPVRHTGFARLT